jgi:pimeloyl-ACP methyl ester carboxylesterase
MNMTKEGVHLPALFGRRLAAMASSSRFAYNELKGPIMNAIPTKAFVVAAVFLILAAMAQIQGENPTMTSIQRKFCLAPDRVTIVYTAGGSGEPALLFIHGGLADRTFWDAQIIAFARKHRVVALDLPGHGESGINRKKWGMPEFGADVAAVVQAERLTKVVLIGNSLGGPVACEAALLLPGKAVGVVGVDTFQTLDEKRTPEEACQRAEAFRADFAGNVKSMTKMLFHTDADPKIMADAEERMARTSPSAAYAMFLSLGGYDAAVAAHKLTVPLRAINGDLFPTDAAGVRKVKPDFEAVIMKHMGHYPMLERPLEFNRLLAEVVAGLSK